MDDTDALLAYANTDAAASKGAVGTVGYCMSGQFAISAAARHPGRINAAASIYGVRLMTDAPDSPHLAARRAKDTEFYIAWAEVDHYAPLEQLEPLRASLNDGGVNAEVELYAGVEHGFAFPERPAYNKDAAEKHWRKLFALYARALR
jgi:carboxymethylenebutenolidase